MHATQQRLNEIEQRLSEFAQVKPENRFYELCYCLLTPQTKAINADHAVGELQRIQFLETGTDPTSILRTPSKYVRFHNQKARRLLRIRSQWSLVSGHLSKVSGQSSLVNSHLPVVGFDACRTDVGAMRSLRDTLACEVDGLGMKEASHFLRNIGARGLAILDRHLLRHLVLEKVFTDLPNIATQARYKEVEKCLQVYAENVSIDMDVLDLVFWSESTGYVGK